MLRNSLIGLLFLLWANSCAAEGDAREQARNLDKQVQDFKQELLEISADLIRLEGKLLYPPKSRISVYLSLPTGSQIPLGAVKIKIDGKEKAIHKYTNLELKALQDGGVQRIYIGNIKPGRHMFEVDYSAKFEGKDAVWNGIQYPFSKGAGTKNIEIVLSGLGSGSSNVTFRE